MKKWKRALVTGASQGLGRALTDRLLDEGIEVVALDRGDIKNVPENHNKLLKLHKINLMNQNQVNALVSDLEKDQKFDLVIHNAGVSATGKFEDIEVGAYQNLMALNLNAPLIITNQLMRHGLFSTDANLLFISSLSHATGYPGAAVYSASKDAISIYAKSIRKPLAKLGIKVTTIFPGPIKTEHAERHAPKGANAEKRMSPDILAAKILDAASKNKSEYYPGMTAKVTAIMGKMAPQMMTKLMRKIIFEKLEKPVW